jgi:hypothetical protein
MPATTKTNRTYRVTPAVGVAVGLIYVIGFSVGGKPGYGLVALGVMVAFSAPGPGLPGLVPPVTLTPPAHSSYATCVINGQNTRQDARRVGRVGAGHDQCDPRCLARPREAARPRGRDPNDPPRGRGGGQRRRRRLSARAGCAAR